MLKPMLKLIRHRGGRGVKAPALLATVHPSFVLRRFGRASRGHVLAGAGVIVAAVMLVSVLTWWAPDSDRPISHPMEALKRALPGVLEKVDEQVATLLGTDSGTVLRNVRGGLVAAGSNIPWPGGKASAVAADRPASRSASAIPAASPAALPGSNAVAPAPGESALTSNESPQRASEPATPSRTGGLTSFPATEAPPPTTSEPAPPPAPETPSVTEAPPPEEPIPPTPEKLPLPAEEIVDKPAPPIVEEPPSGAPPSSAPEAPPPSAPDEPSSPATDQPPPPPPTTGRTAGAE
jgi:hypothetical protein